MTLSYVSKFYVREVDKPSFLNNILRHLTNKTILQFNKSKNQKYKDNDLPSSKWSMCRKLLPEKSKEQKKHNAIRSESVVISLNTRSITNVKQDIIHKRHTKEK